MRAVLWGLMVVLAATIVACGLVLGLKDGELPPAGDAGDAGPPGDERPVLLPDASTATCTGGVDGSFVRDLVADSDAVFVLFGGSTIVNSCGTKVNPCGTIAIGVEVANANRAKAIYIGPGTYAETLDIPSGVAVEGGFDVKGSTWTALCENLSTTLAPPAATTVTANNVLNAAIRFLTIETKPHGAESESLFGVVATNAALTIENVNVYAELGGLGSSGAAGTGNDTKDTNCAESGATGSAGTAGAAGAFTPAGFTVGASGGVGASGLRGTGGTYSAPACQTMCVQTCSDYVFPLDDAGIPIDDAGNEITDGAVDMCSISATQDLCGMDVTAACGGHGGIGGVGGGGGGASVAVFATGASTHLVITGGALVSAGGGLGGPGGSGSLGSNGDMAAAGMGASCFSSCDSSCNRAGSMTLNGGTTTAGGIGGSGGAGGGGAGGPTYLIVTEDSAIVTTAQTSQWMIPMMGATGGAPNGITGVFGLQGM